MFEIPHYRDKKDFRRCKNIIKNYRISFSLSLHFICSSTISLHADKVILQDANP